MADGVAPGQAPDISVIIVSWNTRELLHRCLISVRAEAERGGLRVETIVVDNASRDGSAEHVRAAFPGVTVVALERNHGFAAANNIGLARAAGRGLLLLNPDTELRAGALDALWRALHLAPHVGVVGALLLNPDGSLQSAGYRFPNLAQVLLDFFPLHPRLYGSSLNGRLGPGDGRGPIAIDHPLGACMLVRRAAVEQVGGLDEGYFMYAEEVDWCRRMKQAGWTILTAPAARVVHHGGQSTGQVRREMLIELHRSRARYYRRHEPAWLLAAARLIAWAAAGLAAARSRLRPGDPSLAERSASLRAVAAVYSKPPGPERGDG